MVKGFTLLVDLRKCVGCTSCQVSCKMENATPIGHFRSKVDFADTGEYPKAKRYFFPKICNQCDEPPCILPCPVKGPGKGATYKREDGVVMVDRDLCIGCGRCAGACPYGARFLHPHIPVKNDPKPFARNVKEVRGKKARDLRVVDKCDYCSHRLAQGIEEPTCVRNCVGKARFFGDSSDPQSEVSKIMASVKTERWNPEYETQPRTAFIAPDKEVFKAADGPINE